MSLTKLILGGKNLARESLVSVIPAGDGKILGYNDFDFFEKIKSTAP